MKGGVWVAIVGSLVRTAMAGFGATLVSQGAITEGQLAEVITGVTMLLCTVGWAVWNKWTKAQEYNTARAMTVTASHEEIKAVVKSGQGIPATADPQAVYEITIGSQTLGPPNRSGS